MRKTVIGKETRDAGFLHWFTFSSALIAFSLSANVLASGGDCPQSRDTEYAPAHIASMMNPLAITDDNIDAGEDLYHGDVEPVACQACHGDEGDGDGPMARMFSPPPRDFTCASTMQEITDGQLFWIIKNGSIGTSMPAFDKVSDEKIWQLVMYVRQFSPITNGLSSAD